MRVLVGCEFSGTVRDAFRRRGHDAISCDLLASAAPGPHLQCDVRDVLEDGWDLAIFHPECTYLTSSGLHWNGRPGYEDRAELTEESLAFVRLLMEAPIERICIENPRGCIGTRIRGADQVIQPWQFGHDASKETHLWLKNLPPLRRTLRIPGRQVIYKGRLVERWANQNDAGQNNLPETADRWAKRSVTYQGIADAMADQWSDLPPPIPLLL